MLSTLYGGKTLVQWLPNGLQHYCKRLVNKRYAQKLHLCNGLKISKQLLKVITVIALLMFWERDSSWFALALWFKVIPIKVSSDKCASLQQEVVHFLKRASSDLQSSPLFTGTFQLIPMGGVRVLFELFTDTSVKDSFCTLSKQVFYLLICKP